MALSQSVEESLKDAEQSLRNALAFAARQERPVVCSVIADMINKIESIIALFIYTLNIKIWDVSKIYLDLSAGQGLAKFFTIDFKIMLF